MSVRPALAVRIGAAGGGPRPIVPPARGRRRGARAWSGGRAAGLGTGASMKWARPRRRAGEGEVGMLLRKKDVYAGLAMILLGGLAAVYAAQEEVGSLWHMGPGFFPVALGALLALIGLMTIAVAWASAPGSGLIAFGRMEWRGWGCILAAPVAFIAAGELFGLAAATFLCVFIAALGERTATLRASATLAAGITVFGVLLFAYALKIPFPLFRWGF